MKPDDLSALADAISSLLENPQGASQLGQPEENEYVATLILLS